MKRPEWSATVPKLAFVGPLLGRHAGWVHNPAEVMGPLLEERGYEVRYTSHVVHPILRIADTLAAISAWALAGKVDIFLLAVYSHKAFYNAEIASELIRALGKKQIFILRGGNLPKMMDSTPERIRRVFARADAIVSPSGFLAHHTRQLGFDAQVIPNMLPLEDYSYRHRAAVQPNLLWMRTFSNLYNPFMAVEALAKLLPVLPEARLTMAGQDRGLEEATRKLARRLGVAERVRFAGYMTAESKPAEFGSHDIYLHTNRIDNMPVSVVEAAAFGLPVIATNIGGLPFLVEHEKNALLVPSEDAQAMADAVVRLVGEPDLAAKLSAEGRALAECSDWPVVRAQWEELFARVGGI